MRTSRSLPGFVLVLAALALPSHAAEEGTSEPAAPAAAAPAPAVSLLDDPEIKDWIYFGGNFGYSTLGVSDSLRESDKNGIHLNLKALYSRYFGQWVFDLGGGWFYNKISGDDRTSALANPTVKVITRALFVELSPRYRLDENWQVGGVVNLLAGTDVSFDESTSRGEDPFHVLLGPRVDYELPMEVGRWRFGAQVLTDLTISNRQMWLVQADVQYGIPFGEAKKAPEPEPVAAPPARPQEPAFAEVTPERNVKIYLGEAVLRFRTARHDLLPYSREILVKVAGYLTKANDAWKTMRIEGHTDKRGKLSYNEKLALRRANSVQKELIALGIPAERMTVAGFGPSRPVDPADDLEAYALNRRVELWLDGVNDPDAIMRELNQMRAESQPVDTIKVRPKASPQPKPEAPKNEVDSSG